MALFGSTPADQFTKFIQKSNQLLMEQIAVVKNSWKAIWQNPTMTPQEALDEVQEVAVKAGGTAAEVFANHAATVEYLNTIIPDCVAAPYNAVPNTVIVTVNEDGSLTVTPKEDA